MLIGISRCSGHDVNGPTGQFDPHRLIDACCLYENSNVNAAVLNEFSCGLSRARIISPS